MANTLCLATLGLYAHPVRKVDEGADFYRRKKRFHRWLNWVDISFTQQTQVQVRKPQLPPFYL